MLRNKTKFFLCCLAVCTVLGGCGSSGEELMEIGRGADASANEETGQSGDASSGEEARENRGEHEGLQDATKQDGKESAAQIRVYVCGAVNSPGVVTVPADCRAEDALAAAGGFAENARRDYVNLADWVADGQKLYFPTIDEAVSPAPQEADGGSGLVNINTADASALCALPGIGGSRAEDIIAYREKNGGFGSCEEIMNVPGIKTSIYGRIRDMITVK